MVNYQNGKIYKLWSNESDCFYIGSTTRPLYKRLYTHKNDIKYGATATHTDMTNHTNIRIELIEDDPCNSRDELCAREGHHIRLNREQILNRVVPGRTMKEWYKENKEVLSKRHKEYREKQKESISAQHKTYYEENKETITAQYKTYYEANKEKIMKQHKEYRAEKKRK